MSSLQYSDIVMHRVRKCEGEIVLVLGAEQVQHWKLVEVGLAVFGSGKDALL